MTAASFQDRARTPRWWGLILCLTIGLQLGLIFWLSDYQDARPQRRAYRTHLRLVPSPAPLPSGARPELADPTLFALVTADGFSRSAWLTVTPFSYGLTNLPEPMRWLTLDPDDLASDFAEFVQTNLLAEDVVVNELPATITPPVVRTAAVSSGTVLSVEGGLSDWRWHSPLPLPQFPEPILTNSLVRVLTDGKGQTLSAALLGACGVLAADQAALAYSRTLRFSPRSSSHLLADRPAAESGLLVFRWSQTRWTNQSQTVVTTASVNP